MRSESRTKREPSCTLALPRSVPGGRGVRRGGPLHFHLLTPRLHYPNLLQLIYSWFYCQRTENERVSKYLLSRWSGSDRLFIESSLPNQGLKPTRWCGQMTTQFVLFANKINKKRKGLLEYSQSFLLNLCIIVQEQHVVFLVLDYLLKFYLKLSSKCCDPSKFCWIWF